MPDVEKEDEFELTFLARKLPNELIGVSPTRLVDIYLPQEASNPHIRLRRKGDKYEITKKQPVDENDVSYQTEETIQLSRVEFEALSGAAKIRIEKDRYKVTLSGHEAEVDVFKGNLEGLVSIDFEFSSVEEKSLFVPPACCLVDVTQEYFIAGNHLLGKTYEDLLPELDKFGYKAIKD